MPTYLVKQNVGDCDVGCAYYRKMELYERLKHARLHAKLTQQQVADHFGISRVSVTQWENGSSRPDQTKFADLADLFKVRLEWLMDDRGDPPSVDGSPRPTSAPQKFIKNRTFKFYVKEWREFMGARVDTAARAAGMDLDEYEAFETYPINFGLAQIVALADEFGIRGDQFWFPPPAKSPLVAEAHEKRKVVRGKK